MNLCVWCGCQTDELTISSWRCSSGRCNGRTFWSFPGSGVKVYYRPVVKSRKAEETRCLEGCLFVACEEPG